MERNRPNDDHIELLLSGSAEVPEGFAPLAALFAAVRTVDAPDIDMEAIAGRAAAAAADAVPTSNWSGTPHRSSLFAAFRQRAAAVAVGATVLLGSMSGLAAAADSAKPGDLLYGVDRAFETLGIGDGDGAERLAEAEALIEAGEVPRGLRHAAQAVDKEDAASSALLDAAERVRSGGSEQSAAIREQVAGLLSYISENVGSVDGQQVAELAREIGGEKGDKDNPPGPPADVPADPPGRPDHTPGPPDHSPADPPGHAEDKPGNPPKKDK